MMSKSAMPLTHLPLLLKSHGCKSGVMPISYSHSFLPGMAINTSSAPLA